MDGSEARRTTRALPVKAVHMALDPAWTLDEAVRQLVRGCLAQFEANEPGVTNPRNSEFLHQARIAMRRMRSALRLAPPPEDAVAFFRSELGWLSGCLGEARDWDVLLNDTLPPIARAYAAPAAADPDAKAQMTRLVNAARRRRAQARGNVRLALQSARRDALVAALESWLAAAPAAAPALFTLREYATGELRKRHKRLLRDAALLMERTPEERHRIRINAKRLRYAAEFFGSLFAGKAAKRYLRELVGLQDALGALNDAATATRLLADLPGRDALVPFIRGWIAARETDSLSAAQTALERLAGTPRFWKAAIQLT